MDKKKYSSKRIIRFLLGTWRYSPVAVILMVVFMAASTICLSILSPIFVSRLLSSIATGTARIQDSTWLLVGYGLTLFAGNVVLFRLAMALSYTSEAKMRENIDTIVLKHLTMKSLAFHSDRMTGGIVSDANRLLDSVETFWDNILYNIAPTLTAVAASCIAISFFFWQYALLLASLSIIATVIIIAVQSKAAPLRKKVAEKSAAKTALLADIIGNISAVKAFSGENAEMKRYKGRITDWKKALMDEMKSVIVMTSSFSAIMTIMNIVAFAAAIVATQYHLAGIGAIYLLMTYTLNVSSGVWSISGSTRGYIRAIGDASPMIEVLDEDIEVRDPENPKKLKVSKGEIKFDKVDFTHSENNDALFKDFSLTINPGERVGIVGSSGSGKTSLTRLLLRFSDIDSGEILIDGQNIRSITQRDLHSSIAFVPQEPVLFHRSLSDNIAYGMTGATDADIRFAAKQANALGFIESLKSGFDSLVGERGIKLSGGQRQRIAIARAILKNAPILVLDEATSALDSETEALIQNALEKLMKGRTSIVIAHRLSTISKLDRIVVLEDGEIVEQGTHDELLKLNGVYCKLWLRQSGGFIK